MYFTVGSSMGYEFKFKSLKFGPQKWTQYWNSSLRHLPKSWVSVFEFNFGEFIKMYFINKLAQALVSFVSTKFVLCNGASGWDDCLLFNHQFS